MHTLPLRYFSCQFIPYASSGSPTIRWHSALQKNVKPSHSKYFNFSTSESFSSGIDQCCKRFRINLFLNKGDPLQCKPLYLLSYISIHRPYLSPALYYVIANIWSALFTSNNTSASIVRSLAGITKTSMSHRVRLERVLAFQEKKLSFASTVIILRKGCVRPEGRSLYGSVWRNQILCSVI